MRRMLKEAANAVGGAWPTSELQAVAVSGARNLAIVSRTTTPVWAAVTWRTNLSRKVETFSPVAIRWARLRRYHRPLWVDSWMIHC
jgi:hypothetical protein